MVELLALTLDIVVSLADPDAEFRIFDGPSNQRPYGSMKEIRRSVLMSRRRNFERPEQDR